MSPEVYIIGDVSVIKTRTDFVLIIKDDIYGPFDNNRIKEIIKVLNQDEGGKING